MLNFHTMNSNSYKDEALCVDEMLRELSQPPDLKMRIEAQARDFVKRVRRKPLDYMALEHLLSEYSLSRHEGIALMSLAESLLRIPDSKTAKDLIRDKIGTADWFSAEDESRKRDWLIKASSLGLSLSQKTLNSLFSKVGEPFIYRAMMQAMRIISRQFILGETIEDALQKGKEKKESGYSLSYNMPGEDAHTQEDAARYFQTYKEAITAIAKTTSPKELNRSGISVKLSSLHPRYSFSQREACFPVLTKRLLELAQDAARHNMTLIVDAEEHDRLALSLDIVARVFSHRTLKDWDGFGLTVQAYRKNAATLIDRLSDMAEKEGKKLIVRLVKGAYWNTEIKQAQMKGLRDYPVFTRKANTDLSYLVCAKKMLDNRDIFTPFFATHNAHSVAAILEMAGKEQRGFYFQRLHGMGEKLFSIIDEDHPVPISLYAPVGNRKTLLPYLVKRLMENSANNSFIHQIHDDAVPIKALIAHPADRALSHKTKRHSKIPLPANIYGLLRKNSQGIDLSDPGELDTLLQELDQCEDHPSFKAHPLIGGEILKTHNQVQIRSPSHWKTIIGEADFANTEAINLSFKTAKEGFKIWSETPCATRAKALNSYADLLEEHRAAFISLCAKEAGKTIQDSIAEIRETVNFCRYYAAQGLLNFNEEGIALPACEGEDLRMQLKGRGIFVCISPWNFPLSIFSKQIAAALMAGNAVIAKPAAQTPLIAMKAVQLMHEAGIPVKALNLLPGNGITGEELVEHPDVSGIAFTGKADIAHIINKTLALKKGPVVPFIAETERQNILIADSSALTEQLVDDVISSAFGTAGQRGNALRVLFLQEDSADNVIHMISGAMQELCIGNPGSISTDIGPLIDAQAQERMTRHITQLESSAKLHARVPIDTSLTATGYFFSPALYEIKDMEPLTEDICGPILHVIRYKANDISKVIEMINNTGYGLTLGIHTRIENRVKEIAQSAKAENLYVNRPVTGTITDLQPLYMPRFATERTISINTIIGGGPARLVTAEE